MLGVKGGEGRALSKQPASENEVCMDIYIFIYLYSGEGLLMRAGSDRSRGNGHTARE